MPLNQTLFGQPQGLQEGYYLLPKPIINPIFALIAVF
jgi:hypothetical protein